MIRRFNNIDSIYVEEQQWEKYFPSDVITMRFSHHFIKNELVHFMRRCYSIRKRKRRIPAGAEVVPKPARWPSWLGRVEARQEIAGSYKLTINTSLSQIPMEEVKRWFWIQATIRWDATPGWWEDPRVGLSPKAHPPDRMISIYGNVTIEAKYIPPGKDSPSKN